MTETKHIKLKRGFIVKLTVRHDIQIEEDELEKAMEIWATGKIGIFRQGAIRGDLIACIVPDKERIVNTDFGGYNKKGDYEPRWEFRPLADIFKDVESIKKLPINKQKLLK